jgi:uncharacterized protein DUF2846
MFKKILLLLTIIASVQLTGCASVPMASSEQDQARKEFLKPAEGMAGLYVYRDSSFGAALKKTVSIDGKIIGETAAKTYFYKDIEPGKHSLSTESEFSDNAISINVEAGINYFVRQYIKFGAFVGGADLVPVSEEKGKQGVLSCKLAKESEISVSVAE